MQPLKRWWCSTAILLSMIVFLGGEIFVASKYFTAKTFKFLRDLDANNNRDWFHEHKQDYENLVRTPALDLIEDFGVDLAKFAPQFNAIPNKMGGSLMRVYRDLRFSKDKTPYKINIGIQFRHQMGKDVHTPGYYLHISDQECFIGAGIWRPDGPSLLKIRALIDEKPEQWKRARQFRRSTFELSGSSLVRPPRGFDKEHALLEDLKRKDFIGIQPLGKREIQSTDLPKMLTTEYRKAAPLMKFLCQALEVPF